MCNQQNTQFTKKDTFEAEVDGETVIIHTAKFIA